MRYQAAPIGYYTNIFANPHPYSHIPDTQIPADRGITRNAEKRTLSEDLKEADAHL
jgi:hypothetical protein